MQLNNEGRLILTPEIWEMICDVNTQGNKIVWTSDQELWGVKEKWEFPKKYNGKLAEDCDGISLWKLDALLDKGVPEEVLQFGVCTCETGEYHAVLCLLADRGDYVLDNRHKEVKGYGELKKIGYQFHFRSSIGGNLTGVWQKIAKFR